MLGPLEVRTDDDSGSVLDVGGSRLRAELTSFVGRDAELAPVTDPADLTSVLLSVLGLREQALLSGKLTTRRPSEQGAPGADEQADRILAACPQVHILATSREPLAVIPEFKVTAASAAAVARICRALDGMPRSHPALQR